MNRKLAILAILFGSLLIGLPMETSASAVKETSLVAGGKHQISVSIGQPGRRNRRGGYWHDGRRYRNYGQYRRTQVGYRRYRMVPQYYWRDGRRYTTYRRVYVYR